jgi:hypothetical protein
MITSPYMWLLEWWLSETQQMTLETEVKPQRGPTDTSQYLWIASFMLTSCMAISCVWTQVQYLSSFPQPFLLWFWQWLSTRVTGLDEGSYPSWQLQIVSRFLSHFTLTIHCASILVVQCFHTGFLIIPHVYP